MPPFEDHLPCPSLDRWLFGTWEGRAVASWSCAAQPRWRPPGGLRRMLARRGIAPLSDEVAEASLDVLVVLSPVLGPAELIDDPRWHALRPGGLLVDLGTVPRRRIGELVRPWVHAQRLREAAADRVRYWLERGAFGPEQWAAVEPADVLLTIVRRAVGSGRRGSTA